MRKTEEYKKMIINAIEEQNCFFFADAFPYLPFTRKTAYDHNLNEDEDITEILEKNRLKIKHSLRNKWYKSENPSLQIGLYKLIADDDEYSRLANSKTEVTVHAEQPFFPLPKDEEDEVGTNRGGLETE